MSAFHIDTALCMGIEGQREGAGKGTLTVVSGSRLTSFRVLFGRYTARSTPQQTRLPMKAIGSATANQLSQETELPPLPISWMAKIFCGDEMGLVMPPRLDAKAIPAVAS